MITAQDGVFQRKRKKGEERTEVILSGIRTSELDSCELDWTRPDQNMENGKTEEKMEDVSEGKTGVKKLKMYLLNRCSQRKQFWFVLGLQLVIKVSIDSFVYYFLN